MKKLDNLIRLHQWHLDEKRQNVGELERLATRLRSEMGQLEEEIKSEQEVASKDPEAATVYGEYGAAAIARRQRLQISLTGLESQMVKAVEEVAAAFQEFKKFDLIRSRNQQKADLQNKRDQQKSMDEAGLNLYRRVNGN